MIGKWPVLCVLFAFSGAICSCSKESSHELPSVASVTAQLQYKWSLTSINIFSVSGADSLRYSGTDSDYFNFLANDSAYIYYAHQSANGIYVLFNDTTLLLGDGVSFDTAYIKNLTAHLLVISQPNPPGGPIVDSLKR